MCVNSCDKAKRVCVGLLFSWTSMCVTLWLGISGQGHTELDSTPGLVTLQS